MITETVDPATGLKFITVSGQVGTDANLEATTFQDQNIFSVRLILPATLWYDDVPFDQSFPGGSANVAWRANIFSPPPGDKQAIVSVRMQSTPNPGPKYSGITIQKILELLVKYFLCFFEGIFNHPIIFFTITPIFS